MVPMIVRRQKEITTNPLMTRPTMPKVFFSFFRRTAAIPSPTPTKFVMGPHQERMIDKNTMGPPASIAS